MRTQSVGEEKRTGARKVKELEVTPLSAQDMVMLASYVKGQSVTYNKDPSVMRAVLLRELKGTFGEEMGEHAYTLITRGKHTIDSARAIIKEAFAMKDQEAAQEAKTSSKKRDAKAAKLLAEVAKEALPKTFKEPKVKKAKAPREESTENGGTRRGRASDFAGQNIYPIKEANPRRAGTRGFLSFEIIRGNPGLSVEEFQAKGGRLVDLRADQRRGHVKVGAASKTLAQRASSSFTKRGQRF